MALAAPVFLVDRLTAHAERVRDQLPGRAGDPRPAHSHALDSIELAMQLRDGVEGLDRVIRPRACREGMDGPGVHVVNYS